MHLTPQGNHLRARQTVGPGGNVRSRPVAPIAKPIQLADTTCRHEGFDP